MYDGGILAGALPSAPGAGSALLRRLMGGLVWRFALVRPVDVLSAGLGEQLAPGAAPGAAAVLAAAGADMSAPGGWCGPGGVHHGRGRGEFGLDTQDSGGGLMGGCDNHSGGGDCGTEAVWGGCATYLCDMRSCLAKVPGLLAALVAAAATRRGRHPCVRPDRDHGAAILRRPALRAGRLRRALCWRRAQAVLRLQAGTLLRPGVPEGRLGRTQAAVQAREACVIVNSLTPSSLAPN